MAKIIPTSLVAAISGRTCQNDSTHFATNKVTGKVYAVKVCNPADCSNPTDKQQEVRTAFATASAIVKAWRAANAPTAQSPLGSAEFQAMMKQYKAQHKVGNWMAFVRTKIKDGAVPSFVVAGSEGSTQQPTPTPPAGGGDDNTFDP